MSAGVGEDCRQDCTVDCGHCKGRPGAVAMPRECRRWSRARGTWVAKAKFGSRADAVRDMDPSAGVEPYRCGNCDWWHVGHARAEK